jgi:hypothetical protein
MGTKEQHKLLGESTLVNPNFGLRVRFWNEDVDKVVRDREGILAKQYGPEALVSHAVKFVGSDAYLAVDQDILYGIAGLKVSHIERTSAKQRRAQILEVLYGFSKR